MSEQVQNQGYPPVSPSIWGDIKERLKRKESDMILALGSAGIAVIQIMGGVSMGSFMAAIALMNLSLIGWLGNTGWRQRKEGTGSGLLVIVSITFAVAAWATLLLCEDITRVNTGITLLNQ